MGYGQGHLHPLEDMKKEELEALQIQRKVNLKITIKKIHVAGDPAGSPEKMIGRGMTAAERGSFLQTPNEQNLKRK